MNRKSFRWIRCRWLKPHWTVAIALGLMACSPSTRPGEKAASPPSTASASVSTAPDRPTLPATQPQPQDIAAPEPDYGVVLTSLPSRTRIPILLPSRFPIPEKLYGDIDTADETGYVVTLDFVPDCHGAAACTFGRMSGASLTANTPALQGKKVALANQIVGYFSENDTEENCNTGYCFAKLAWDMDGVRYTLKLKSPDLNAFLQTANSALNRRPE